MTDEAALQALLDSKPDDWTTRLVLADLLEEQGRDDEAACQRWMVAERKMPDKLNGHSGAFWCWRNRSWADGSDRIMRYRTIPALSHCLHQEMYRRTTYLWYSTRREAEAGLCSAIKSLRSGAEEIDWLAPSVPLRNSR